MKHVLVDGVIVPEPQNNWKIVYEELLALACKKEFLDIIESINNGNPLDIENDSLMKEFSLSFPGLVWLLWKIMPKMIIPLLISQNLYINEINMKAEYIIYIRDMKTAETIATLYPSLSCAYSFVEKIEEKYETAKYVGWIYWMIASGKSFNCKELDYVERIICRRGHFELFKLILPYAKNKDQLATNTLSYGYTEGLSYLCDSFDSLSFATLLNKSIAKKYLEATKILYEKIEHNIDGRFMRDTITRIIMVGDEGILSFFLSKEEFVDVFYSLSDNDLQDLIMIASIECIEILLSLPLSIDLWHHILKKCIETRKTDIVSLILRHKTFIMPHLYSIRAVNFSDAKTLSIILNDPSYSSPERWDEDYMVIKAILSGKKEILHVLMDHPKVNKSRLEERYLIMAKNLLQS